MLRKWIILRGRPIECRDLLSGIRGQITITACQCPQNWNPFCKLLCPTSPTFLEKSSRNYPTNCSLLKQFIKERNLLCIFKIFWFGVAKKLCRALGCLFFKKCISKLWFNKNSTVFVLSETVGIAINFWFPDRREMHFL